MGHSFMTSTQCVKDGITSKHNGKPSIKCLHFGCRIKFTIRVHTITQNNPVSSLQMGNVLNKFGCSKHLEFPNGVVVNERQEIFISDNRAHCVKVFSYEGVYLRQIGAEGKWLMN